MAYTLIVTTPDLVIEQLVFAASKRQALKLADQLALGRRIISRRVREVF